MKSFLLSILVLTILISANTYSQDIRAKLRGHLAVNGFTVIDDLDNVLFRVTGEGNVGIGNANPLGLLDTRRTISTGLGRSIYLQGESVSEYTAVPGDVIIAGGDGVEGYDTYGGKITLEGASTDLYPGGGDITIKGGDSAPFFGGNVKIEGGFGDTGGDVDIIGGMPNNVAGSINLTTSGGHVEGGSINLTTGSPGGLNTGDITLRVRGGGSGNPGHINLICEESYNSSNINLTPGTSGLVIINGSGTYSGTWTQASDERFKKNVKPIHNAVDKIEQLNGVSYEFKSDEFPEKQFTDGRQIGLIAQDVEKVFPELVKTDAEGYKSVAYQNMVAVLIEAVKEQQKFINELKKEVEKLKSNQNIEVTANTKSSN